jgi:HEAT repeat protein
MNTAELLASLQHGDRHVRDEAFDQIARSRDLEILEPLAELARPSSTYLETLFCQYIENIPANLAIPHLQKLLLSPHLSTREHALKTLDRIPIDQRIEPLIDLISCPHRDVQLHVLNEMGIHRRSVALHPIRPLLESDDQELCQAAFAAIQRIDIPRSMRMLLPYLKAHAPWRCVAALEALGSMDSFGKWKRFLPCLKSSDAEVRLSAILNLSRKGAEKASRHLVRHLECETEEEPAKLTINRLALYPDKQMARVLLRIAATHENPQLRRSASWVIEELDEALLRQAMLDLLRTDDEEIQAYILTKMGTRQLPDCGAIITSHLDANYPARVRYAALEGLGFLHQREYLSAVEPYLQSDDPMAAYVATLTAVQLIQKLDDCPQLTSLLLSPDGEHIALKQIVLQFMIDSISWQFDDPKLFQVLVNNLNSSNENISYLSAILLGKCRGRHQLVEPLLQASLENPSDDIRQVARESLNQVLDGDISPLLKKIETPMANGKKLCDFARLLSTLTWGPDSAFRALKLFASFQCPEEANDASLFLEDIARGLYQANPQACRDFFVETPTHSSWHLAIGKVWLLALSGLTLPEERADWQVLFASEKAELMLLAARRAVYFRATWTIETLVARIAHHADGETCSELRAAVNQLLEL